MGRSLALPSLFTTGRVRAGGGPGQTLWSMVPKLEAPLLEVLHRHIRKYFYVTESSKPVEKDEGIQ